MTPSPLERHVVRPRPRKLLLTLLGCVAFVAVGIWMLSSGDLGGIVVGLLAVAFFGGVGVYAVVTSVRQGLAKLTLTPSGLELASGGTVPWPDVEATGVVTEPTTMVWLRLRSYDRYLDSIPDGRAAKADGISRVLTPVAQLLLRGTARGARMRDQGDQLRWTREHFGYDLAFSPAWLDRPAAEFAELLERYRQAAG